MQDITTRYQFSISSFSDWFSRVLLSRGFDEQESALGTRFAVEAALHEVETHGARKLLHLLDHEFLEGQSCQPGATHDVHVRAGSLEVWDANRKLGPAIASLAQERSIEIAESVGVGVVFVRHANHYGWGGAYVLPHMGRGLLCGNFCQGATPIVTPLGGTQPRMGSNAISIAMESHHEDCPIFLWDAGMGSLSWGEVQRRRLDGTPLAADGAIDESGRSTRDPSRAASLLPAGSIGHSIGFLIEMVAAHLGAGDPRYRSSPVEDVPAGEPTTCVFVHFTIDLKQLDGLQFPHQRSRQENVAAMVDALLKDNGVSRLVGQRKWLARKRSEEVGGLLFTEGSMEAFRQESLQQGVPLPDDVQMVTVQIPVVDVANK